MLGKTAKKGHFTIHDYTYDEWLAAGEHAEQGEYTNGFTRSIQ
jgi:hypothetical protein